MAKRRDEPAPEEETVVDRPAVATGSHAEHPVHGTGYIPDPWDEHVIPFAPRGSTPKKARRLPREIEPIPMPKRITDQGSMGKCVGASLTEAAEGIALRERKVTTENGIETVPGVEVEWSNLFTYLLGRLALYGLTLEGYRQNRDQRVSVDTGAMIGATVRMLNKHGFVSRSLWPEEAHGKFADVPSQAALEQASRHVLLQARSVENHEALMQALYEGHPVVLGFDVPTNFGVDSSGQMRRPSGQYSGGHAVIAVGYKADLEFPAWQNRGGLLIRNSWGERWGGGSMTPPGHFWMPFDFFNSPRVSDAWALVAVDSDA